jgi:WD40 repeat protein
MPMRQIKYLFAILFSVLLLEAGCAKKPSGRQAATVPIAQNIPDYAKVQLVASDKHSQTIKFRGQVGEYVFSPNGNELVVATYTNDSPEITKQPPAKRIYNVLHFWDLKTHQLIRYMTFKNQEIYSITFSPNGKYLVASINQEAGYNKYPDIYLYIWDAHTGKLLKQMLLFHSSDQAYSPTVKFSPQGRLLALNSMVDIQLIDTSSWKMSRDLHMVASESQPGMLQNEEEAFSSDGKKVAATSCNLNTESETAWTLTVWNAKTGKPQLYLNDSKFVLDPHDDFTCLDVPISFLADDHTIVAGAYTLDTRNLKQGAKKLISTKDLSKLDSTKFQNIGLYVNKNKELALLACWDKSSKLVLWDLKSKKVLHTWKGSLAKHEPDAPPNVVFSPDGNQVAFNLDSGINSNMVQIWNIP